MQMQHEFSMPPVRMEDLMQKQTPTQSQSSPESKQEEPEEEKKQEWASLRPQASSFGAPVILYDEPDDGDLPQIESAQEAIEPDYQGPAANEQLAEQELTQEEDLAPEEKTSEPEQTPLIEPLSKSIEQLIEKISPETLNAIQEQTPSAKPARQTNRTKRTRRRKRAQKKQAGKNITLADITQGFLEQWKNKGPNLVRMYGNDNAAPTDEQIRYERYAARILWCLQNAWKIKLSELPRHAAVESELQICMVINKQGKLENVTVVRSCGHSEIDRFIVGTIQYAGSSFPPLPGFIKEEPFYMPWVIKLHLEKQGGPARFSMY